MSLVGDIQESVVHGAVAKAVKGFVDKGEITPAQGVQLTDGIMVEIQLALEIWKLTKARWMIDEWSRRAVVLTCCIVITMTFGALLYGLFDLKVENDKIFSILEHAFPMVLIAVLGLIKTTKGGSDA